ncbi:hypothetical protein EAH87_11525 [Sphingomonas koreensis]|nr:hypothetical protein EAH87_11525 [Sphingomonas koreensis]
MHKMLGAVLAASGFAMATGAAAQSGGNIVKDGVDAWSRGDYKTAIKDWQGPADKGDADAEYNLGQAYRLGRGVPVDMAKAQGWYGKAAAQGHFQAEDNYGRMLFQSGHQAESAPWLEKSVARGDPRAQLILGTMLFNGDGGQAKNWPRAYALLVRASASGLPEATQTRAEMDKYIPEDQRKQGLALARQYEANAQRAQLPPEVTAAGRPPAKATPAPNQVAHAETHPGAPYPTPGAKPTPPARPTPPSHAAQPASAKPAAHGNWRVQLGAFGNEARARSLWSSLSPKVASLRGGQPYIVHAGSVVRLQAGGFASSAEASRVCGEVKRAGGACLPVAP